MKKVTLILALLFTGSFVYAENLGEVNALRVIFDLIKDTDVTATSNYASVDVAEPALVIKYAEAMYKRHPREQPLYPEDFGDVALRGTPIPWVDATNNQRARTVRKILRRFIRNNYVAYKRENAAVDAGRTAREAAEAETDTDLGTDGGRR